MFLKQIFARKAKLRGKGASFKNIKFGKGNYTIRLMVPAEDNNY